MAEQTVRRSPHIYDVQLDLICALPAFKPAHVTFSSLNKPAFEWTDFEHQPVSKRHINR